MGRIRRPHRTQGGSKFASNVTGLAHSRRQDFSRTIANRMPGPLRFLADWNGGDGSGTRRLRRSFLEQRQDSAGGVSSR